MSPVAIIHAVGAVGLFPSRAFIPAFVTSLILRYGHKIPFLADNPLLQQVQETWLTHDVTILVLGVLSVLEIWGSHDPDIRQFMDRLDQYLKPAMALLTTFGVLTAADRHMIEVIQQASLFDGLLALAVGSSVFVLVRLRQEWLEWLDDIDDDNSMGLHTLFGWIEDIWASLGILLLFLFPLLMAVLVFLVFAVLKWLQRSWERREEARKIPCSTCGAANYRSAVQCFQCSDRMPAPRDVNFFGLPKPEKAAADEHSLKLLEKKRCPVCASHLKRQIPQQQCIACAHQIFQTADLVRKYDRFIHRRLWRVLPITFSFSLIPVLGIIPAVVYYRLVWVVPYRRYIRTGRILLTRIVVGFLSLFLLAFQWVPLIGGLSLPLMASLNHFVYRRAFLAQFDDPAMTP